MSKTAHSPTDRAPLVRLILVALSAMLIVGPALLVRVGLPGVMYWLYMEDGPVESLGALASLAAALLFATAAIGRSGRRRFWLVIWTLATIFLFGEEISWGQRVIGIETPDWFARRNEQQELNLHNLSVSGWGGLHNFIEPLFLVALFLYLAAFPLLARREGRFARWLRGWKLPVASRRLATATFGLFFVFVLASFLSVHNTPSVGEGVETAIGLLVFTLSMESLLASASKRPIPAQRTWNAASLALFLVVTVALGWQCIRPLETPPHVQYAQLMTNIAGDQIDAGDPHHALEVATLATNAWPRGASPWLIKASALYRLGRYDEAQRAIERSLAIDRRQPDALVLAGIIAQSQLNFAGAIAWLNAAAEQSPDRADIYFLRGGARLCLRQEAAALEDLAHADRLDPAGAINRALKTSELCLQIGRPALARQFLDKVLAANPDHTQARAMAQRLSEGTEPP